MRAHILTHRAARCSAGPGGPPPPRAGRSPRPRRRRRPRPAGSCGSTAAPTAGDWPTRAPSPTNRTPATTPAAKAIAGRTHQAGRASRAWRMPDEERRRPRRRTPRARAASGGTGRWRARRRSRTIAPSSGPKRTASATAATRPRSGTTPAMRRCGINEVCRTTRRTRSSPRRATRITGSAIRGRARTRWRRRRRTARTVTRGTRSPGPLPHRRHAPDRDVRRERTAVGAGGDELVAAP